jgi:hypothetical protein
LFKSGPDVKSTSSRIIKKEYPKKYMMVFGVESFGKELYFIATTGGANN